MKPSSLTPGQRIKCRDGKTIVTISRAAEIPGSVELKLDGTDLTRKAYTVEWLIDGAKKYMVYDQDEEIEVVSDVAPS